METIITLLKTASGAGACIRALVLICCLSFVQHAGASHIVGSDIAYRCTGTPGLYKVTLILYKRCGSTGVAELCNNCTACTLTPSVAVVGADVAGGCNNTSFGTVPMTMVGTPREVNPGILADCPMSKTRCRLAGCKTDLGPEEWVERYEFEGQVNLGPTSGIPASCCMVRLSWSNCCRNENISTISGPGSANFYTEAIINRCAAAQTPCNSSPTMSNDPYAVACKSEPFTFNIGAIDPDLDSLSYSFTPSLLGPGNPVNYTGGYTYDQPMPYRAPQGSPPPAGIYCDPITGDISFTPDFIETGVMAVEVKQWKIINGVPLLVGVTRRDLQMTVRICPPNNPPRITTNPPDPSGGAKAKWDVCAGSQICFDIIAKDEDFNPPILSDTTKLSWDGALARFGATFLPNYDPLTRKINGPREDTWKFCWTPQDDRASNTPYYFTVQAKDSRCLIPGTAGRAFSIRVLPRPNVTLKKEDKKCGSWRVYYDPNITPYVQNFSSRIFNISKEPGDFSFSQGAHTYTNTQTTPVIKFRKPGKYLVELTMSIASPSGGQPCIKSFYDTITQPELIEAVLRDTFVCFNQPLTIRGAAKNATAVPIKYYWYNSIKDSATPPLNNPYLTVSDYTPPINLKASKRFSLRVQDINGCDHWDSLYVEVKQPPQGTMLDSMRICFVDSFVLNPGNAGGMVSKFLWNTGDTAQSITRRDSGRYIVRLTDTLGCIGYDTLKLFVNLPVNVSAGIDDTICKGDTATLAASMAQLYLWSDITPSTAVPPLPSKSHKATFKVKPASAGSFQYVVKGFVSYPDTTLRKLECSNTDTVTLFVKELPQLSQRPIVQECRSSTFATIGQFNTFPQDPAAVGVWSYAPAPGALSFNPTTGNLQVRIDSLKNAPAKDTPGVFQSYIKYTHTASWAFGGCTTTDSAIVRVFGIPKVSPGPPLTWCENAGIYNITPVAQKFSPVTMSNVIWTGPGITGTNVGTSSATFRFDPNDPAVTKGVSAPNVMNFRYRQSYTSSSNPGSGFNPPIQPITCIKDSTVEFTVVPTPAINAGYDRVVCKNAIPFSLNSPPHNVVSPSGKSYWQVWRPTYNPVTKQPVTPPSPNELALQAQVLGNNPTFDPGAFTPLTPDPDDTSSVFVYMGDTSTGCLVYDVIRVIMAKVPDVTITSVAHPLERIDTVCKSTGEYNYVSRVNGAFHKTGTLSAIPALGTPPYFHTHPTNNNATGNLVFDSDVAGIDSVNKLIYAWSHVFTQTGAGAAPSASGLNVASCPGSDTITMRAQDPPVVDVTVNPTAICAYDKSVKVSAVITGGDYEMIWSSNGSGTFDQPSHFDAEFSPSDNDKTAGTVSVTATTLQKGKCPIASDNATLTIHKVPEAAIDIINQKHCVPFTATISAKDPGPDFPDVSYRWEWNNHEYTTDTNAKTFNRNINEFKGTGTYPFFLIVRSNTNPACVDTSEVSFLQAYAVPLPSFEPDPPFTTIAKPFFNFINNSTSPDNSKLSFKWRLGPLDEGGPERFAYDINLSGIEYSADTARKQVWLIAESEFGCKDSTPRFIRIDPDITVFVPTAFYPNSRTNCRDGELCNRVFKVVADGYMTFEVFVFNRWGQEVFHSRDANEGWDGTIKNSGTQDCPQDVYIYQIHASSYNGKQYKYSGSVTLLR